MRHHAVGQTRVCNEAMSVGFSSYLQHQVDRQRLPDANNPQKFPQIRYRYSHQLP